MHERIDHPAQTRTQCDPATGGKKKCQPGKGTNHHKLPPIAWTTYVAPRAQLKGISWQQQPANREA